MSFFRWVIFGLLLTAVVGEVQAAPPAKKPAKREYLPPALSWLRNVESVQMFAAILSGNPPSSGDMGWFHPGQSAYSLKWLVERMDKDHDGAIDRKEFTGPSELFDRMDRNHDGQLTAADFDWSDASPLTRQMQMLNPFFRRADTDHNEKITSAEWQALFQEAAKGKDSLSREELHALLFPPPPPRPKKPTTGMPSPVTLVKGLFNGEIGSLHEGPSLGQLAPNFTLKTFDKGKTLSLSRFRGKKPVVLVFGSFT
jgi:hypothetical protein